LPLPTLFPYTTLFRSFLGERLRPLQWLAVGIVLAAVINLSLRKSGFPWLAVSLALSFGFYGLVRKQVNINSLHALMVESLILLADRKSTRLNSSHVAI